MLLLVVSNKPKILYLKILQSKNKGEEIAYGHL